MINMTTPPGQTPPAFDIPVDWTRGGLILPRRPSGEGAHVVGDPCVVWDDALPGWRMFLFFDPPGHGQAVCRTAGDIGPGRWELEGPLLFTNSAALLGGSTHKPWVVMDARRPNRAARIGGRFCLLTVSFDGPHKVIQRAWAETLAGPWTVDGGALIPRGGPDDFDGKHADAVSGFHFADRGETLIFTMGYPDRPQTRNGSPWGSAQGAAVMRDGEHGATKLGVILPPADGPGHWAGGWVGGLQILPGRSHRWIALVNASPTAPDPSDPSIAREEPAPSLGGFAVCDEAWPVSGWRWHPDPIEWIEDIPAGALAAGEGTNLWRQHLLALPDGRLALFYNSGFYGQEQLYLKTTPARLW